jgi:hypothetical protein
MRAVRLRHPDAVVFGGCCSLGVFLAGGTGRHDRGRRINAAGESPRLHLQAQKLRQPRGTTKLANSARSFPSSAHGPGTLTMASALVGNLLSI